MGHTDMVQPAPGPIEMKARSAMIKMQIGSHFCEDDAPWMAQSVNNIYPFQAETETAFAGNAGIQNRFITAAGKQRQREAPLQYHNQQQIHSL